MSFLLKYKAISVDRHRMAKGTLGKKFVCRLRTLSCFGDFSEFCDIPVNPFEYRDSFVIFPHESSTVSFRKLILLNSNSRFFNAGIQQAKSIRSLSNHSVTEPRFRYSTFSTVLKICLYVSRLMSVPPNAKPVRLRRKRFICDVPLKTWPAVT